MRRDQGGEGPMSEIRDRLRQRFSSLTKVQKDLAHRLLTSYEDYIFLSIDEAAQALGVHKSTLVRLAQRLGYPGYTEFRSDLQELYRQEITPGRKLGKTLAEIHEDNLFQQVIETEIMYLREALKTVHPTDFRRAAALILKAKRVFICGRGPQVPLAELLAFRLRRFHLDVHVIAEEGRAILEKLQLLTAKDVLILYSFIAVPKEHLMAITLAAEVGCPVILVTDTVAKDMVDGVALVLAARRGPATIYHTDIVPMAIQTALVLQIAKMRAPQVLRRLERLQELRRRFGYEHSVIPHQ
ncbi:MAG: MurR/RpiR family transcriptional regulator [Candidatus Acetothermia bacterium]|nr:MurR/RpiR family transcriptional regulator [Candidatus Acetothermia bacterium]